MNELIFKSLWVQCMMRYPQHILVIDGDDQYRKLLVEILSTKDYMVFSAQDKTTAEFILDNNPIDLIIENVGKQANLVSEELIQSKQDVRSTTPKILAMSGDPSVLAQLKGRVAGLPVKGQETMEKLLQQVAQILFA